jgi:hypothetical protein
MLLLQLCRKIGNNNAVTVATQLLNDFRSIRPGLSVGIGGGIPSDVERDIRLRSVMIRKPTATFGRVVQFDRGRICSNRQFKVTESLKKLPAVLMANACELEAKHGRINNQISECISDMLKRYPNIEGDYVIQA